MGFLSTVGPLFTLGLVFGRDSDLLPGVCTDKLAYVKLVCVGQIHLIIFSAIGTYMDLNTKLFIPPNR